MLAHYVLGCTYRDMGEAPHAIDCYLDAAIQADTTAKDCDFYTLSCVYSQMAEIYYKQLLLSAHIDASRKASYYSFKANKPYYGILSLDKTSASYILLNKIDSAECVLKKVFSNLSLSENAKLYIINEDESVLYGPVTYNLMNEDAFLLTDIIAGSKATIYLYEPTEEQGNSSLEITRVIHGYKYPSDTYNTSKYTRGNSTAVPACFTGWYEMANSVGLIISSTGTIGTGTLVMTTDYSFKPYFITNLWHIDTDKDGVISSSESNAIAQLSFRFCSQKTTCNGSTLATTYTYTGAQLKSYWSDTRFALLELTQNVQLQSNIMWAGWNRSGNNPSAGIWIGNGNNSNELKIAFKNQNIKGKSFIIDTTGWHSGIYIVNVTNSKEALSQKLLLNNNME